MGVTAVPTQRWLGADCDGAGSAGHGLARGTRSRVCPLRPGLSLGAVGATEALSRGPCGCVDGGVWAARVRAGAREAPAGRRAAAQSASRRPGAELGAQGQTRPALPPLHRQALPPALHLLTAPPQPSWVGGATRCRPSETVPTRRAGSVTGRERVLLPGSPGSVGRSLPFRSVRFPTC